MVREVSRETTDVERTIERIFAGIGPDGDPERRRSLRLELDACEAVRDALYSGERRTSHR